MTEELNQQSLSMLMLQLTYSMSTTAESRSRFSKQIAEELLATKGEFAHLYALEKLEGHEVTGLWRDVLTWLDELGGNDGRGVDKDRDGCGEEQ